VARAKFFDRPLGREWGDRFKRVVSRLAPSIGPVDNADVAAVRRCEIYLRTPIALGEAGDCRDFRHRRRRDAGFTIRIRGGNGSRDCIADHCAVADHMVIAKDVEADTGLRRPRLGLVCRARVTSQLLSRVQTRR
jgi:hypothetical protein